ncbi:hypothetical protein EZV62_002060 [Acer yangbiense]|uniref:Uncharacterized protein n=1 Tax=Acer yangbiense TaxID=1000413 RepID=A0A5C7IW12_9ROSI|nr:hypothetical protein EZV62_002060 [Acer yangbiense]
MPSSNKAMAAGFPERQAPVNPCCNCQVCKERYSKLQEKRNALRQALKLLEQQLDKIQADNLRLKKAYEVEKARAEDEKKGREKEVAARVPLETEIATLKSEISLLQQKGVSPAQDRSEEVKRLQDRVSKGEKEINRVKDLLEKEKQKADLEKKNVVEEKKRAAEAWNYVKAEKGKADEERKIADIERKMVEEYRLQLEALSKEANDAKSKLVSGTLKLEGGNNKLEAVKQQATKERKRADSEMAKAKEQGRLAEANRKQAEEEKCRAENFSQQLEEARGRNEKLEKKMHELVRSRYSSETLGGKPNKTTNAEFSKIDQGIGIGRRVGSQTELVLKPVEQSKRSEVEKQKAISKKKLAEIEMGKSHEYRKLADLSQKQAMEEKYRADQLSQQLEEARGRIDELQKRIHDLLSSRKLVEASAVSPEKYSNTESMKVKDLKKQLKFEKMRVKHAKEVAKLEKSRNSILQQELGRLKLDFVQFIHRLDVLDKCFSTDAECIGYSRKEKVDMQMLKLKEKLSGLEPFQMFLPRENELSKPCSTVITGSGPPRQAVHHIAPVLPLSGANCSESISGIDSKDSKLESLLGGSSRKILQSSAINSISASFSDGQLVGSQERGAFSVTTSSKMIEESLNAQPTNSSMPGEVERMRCNGNLAVVGENSVRSPHKIGSVGGPSRKRKRIVDAIESIELLRKLHLQMEEKMSDLHDMLNRQVEKYSKEAKYKVPNPQENSYFKQDKFHKKRKTSHRESVGIRNLLNSNESKKTAKTDAKVHEDAIISRQASEHATALIVFAQTFAEGIRDSVINNHETMVNFEEVANGDYMKLLDLDNPAEEECYKTAMEMPMSPTLPEIYFQGGETVDVDIIKPLQQEGFYGCLSNEKENSGPSYCFDVINVEIDSIGLKYDVSGTSHCSSLHENEGPVDSLEHQGIDRNGFHSTVQAGKVCDHQAQDFGMEMVISDLCGSRDKGVKMLEITLGTAHKNIINHFIVSHDIEDSISISRIFCATRTCMARCSLATEKGSVLRKILLALKMEENLHSKEKACVFLSLLLVNFSTAAVGKSGNFLNSDFILCLDSFHGDVSAVMSDAEVRSVFDKLCLDELLRLIVNFLMDGRVMKYREESSLIDCNSKINIVLDGVNTILYSEAASADQLVAGSIILASICAATDHTGFICEASYNIFRMHRCDLSLVLTILHIFAYLGREKYFTLREHNLTMTVLKSMVTCIERRSSSIAETVCPSSAHQVPAEFHPCTKCPFSKDAVSVDIAISLLLKKLQSYAQSGTMNALSHKDQAEQSCLDFCCVFGKSCSASCILNKCEIPAFQSDSVVNITSCHFSDVLSLVELLAYNMSWDWTCTTIFSELLRMLESPLQESFTVAVVILLGQLGRIGVNACGYEDKEVESLRNKLSAFLMGDTTIVAALPVQIATVSALLGLLPLDFEHIVEINAKHPIISSQSVPADCIRKWFSLLSKKNQALSSSLLQPLG